MKMIIAIVRPEKLPDVTKELTNIGVRGMTISEVKGRGNQKGIILQSRDSSHEVEFLPKAQIMLVVNDDDLDRIVETMITAAKTDRGPGDGKVFVCPCTEVIRIRTGERDGASCI